MGRRLGPSRATVFEIQEGRTKVQGSAARVADGVHVEDQEQERAAASLRVNAVQREYAKNATKRSIVLKARQLGITTYVAARFFLNCLTRPGTLCVQVAHDQRSAEEIFRIVHRLLANLPDYCGRER